MNIESTIGLIAVLVFVYHMAKKYFPPEMDRYLAELDIETKEEKFELEATIKTMQAKLEAAEEVRKTFEERGTRALAARDKSYEQIQKMIDVYAEIVKSLPQAAAYQKAIQDLQTEKDS